MRLRNKKEEIQKDLDAKFYTAVDLNRLHSRSQKVLVPHILLQYELKEQYKEKINDLNTEIDERDIRI